jgi:serine/threonine protein kinase
LGELRDDTVQDWNSFAMSRSSSVCHFNTVPRWSPPPSSFPSPQANKSNQKQSKLGSAADGTTTTMPATSFVFDMSWFLQHALVSSHEWGAVHGSLFLQGKHDALLRTILESLSRSPSPLGCSAADGAVTTAASPLSAALLSGGGLPNAARSTDSARTPPGSATTNHLSPAATTALTPSLLLTSSSSPQVTAAPSNVHAAGAMIRPSQYLEEKHLEHDRRIVRMSTTTDYRIVAVRDLLGATDSTKELWHHHTAGVAYQGFTILAESPSFPFPQLRDPRGEDEALRAPALLRRSMRKFLSRLSQLYTDARQQCSYLFPCVGVVDQDYRGGGSATPACGILYPDVSHRTAVAPMMKTLEQLFANATGLGGGGGGLELHHHQQQQHYSSSSVYLPRRWSEGHVQSWGLSLAHALEALHSRHAAAGFVSPFTVFVPIEVSSSSFSSSHSNNNATLGGTVLLCEQAALFLWKQLCSSQAGHDARAVLLGPNSHSHHQATGGSANADSSHSPAVDATKLQTVPLEVLAGFLPPELLAQLSTRTDTGNDASAYTNQFIGEWVCGTLYGAIKKTSSSSSSAHAADMAEEARRPSVGTDPHFPQQEGTPSPSSLDTTSEALVDLKAADVYMFGATLWWIATGGVSLYEFLSIHHPHPSSSSSYAAAAPSSSPYGGRLGDASQQPSRTSAASGRSPREGAFGVHTTLPQAATKHLESLEAYDNHVFQSTRHAAHQTASFSAAPQQPQQQRIVVEPLQPQLLGGGTSAPQQQQQQQAWGKKYYATPNLFGSAGQLMRQLRLSLMRAKVARVKPPYDVHALFPDTAASHASYNKKEQPPATTTTASFPNTTESQSHRENSTTSASMPPSDALPLLKFEGQARSASFVLLCDLLHACLQRDPSHRPSMREVLRHPFFAVVPVAPLQLPHHVDIALPTFLHLQHVVSSSSAVVDPSPSSPSAANYHNSMDAVSSPSAAVVTPSSLTAAAAPVHPWYALAPLPSLLPPTTSSPSQQGSPTSTAASAALRPPLPIPSEGFLECVDGSSMLQTVPNGFVLHGDLVRNAGKHAVSDVTPGVQLLVVQSDPSHTARRDAAVAAVRAEALVAVAAAAESGRTEEGGNGVEVVRSMKQELSSHSLGLLFGY